MRKQNYPMSAFARVCCAIYVIALIALGSLAILQITGCTQLDRAATAMVTPPPAIPSTQPTQAEIDAQSVAIAKAIANTNPYGGMVVGVLTLAAIIYSRVRSGKNQSEIKQGINDLKVGR